MKSIKLIDDALCTEDQSTYIRVLWVLLTQQLRTNDDHYVPVAEIPGLTNKEAVRR